MIEPAAPQPHPKLDALIAVLEQLRAPGGCAWDREQTHESLVQYLVEETYELVEAIESGDPEEMLEELGDVLYQVVFHSDIAREAGLFTLEDVAGHMTAKMIGRHPHVFGDTTAATADDVMAVWDDLKRTEKPHRTSVLDGIPQGMPALALADKLLGRAHSIGLPGPLVAGAVGAGAVTQGNVSQGNVSEGNATNGDLTPGQVTAGQVKAVPIKAVPITAVQITDEEELGPLLLSIVASAKANGLDSERALRTALRELQQKIRDHEIETSAEII